MSKEFLGHGKNMQIVDNFIVGEEKAVKLSSKSLLPAAFPPHKTFGLEFIV